MASRAEQRRRAGRLPIGSLASARDDSFEAKKRRLQDALCRARQTGGRVALRKRTTSNLFRHRVAAGMPRLDVRAFHRVIGVNAAERTADAEGMTPYEALTDAALAHGLLPTVVPELKTITIGGAATGLGIESSSFRFGLVHETLLELEVLLGSGETVVCRRDNEHKDLFYGFPNSYGTLGYALRVKVELVAAGPYVYLRHRRFSAAEAFLDAMAAACRDGRDQGAWDYVDGVVFDPQTMVLTTARFSDKAPYVGDYTGNQIYYQSLLRRDEDYLTAHDYIWRWDTDWFWCSKHFGVQHPLLRRLVPKSLLRSSTYWQLMNWNSRYIEPIKRPLRTVQPESVIQDVQIPLERCGEFLDFFHREIGIRPIWVCPTQLHDTSAPFSLYPMRPGQLYLNFGFWDFVRPPRPTPPGHYNRLIERTVARLDGKKSLYSSSFYDEDEFWRLYNREAYERLKRRYDPDGVFRNLYEKCVLRA